MQKTVLIEVGDYSDSDLPRNANDLLAFWQAELQKVPAEYRQSAEIKRFNASYEGDWDDWRTTLEYPRLETLDEAAARVERTKVAGTKISITNNGVTIVQDGVVRVRLGDLSQPFAVEGDQVFLNSAFVRDGVTKSDPLPQDWGVKLQVNVDGRHILAGIGVGLADQVLVKADEFAINDRRADQILDEIAKAISETDLARSLEKQIEPAAEQIRKIIALELRPGGMLYRFSR
jgi:hypothetical protein